MRWELETAALLWSLLLASLSAAQLATPASVTHKQHNVYVISFTYIHLCTAASRKGAERPISFSLSRWPADNICRRTQSMKQCTHSLTCAGVWMPQHTSMCRPTHHTHTCKMDHFNNKIFSHSLLPCKPIAQEKVQCLSSPQGDNEVLTPLQQQQKTPLNCTLFYFQKLLLYMRIQKCAAYFPWGFLLFLTSFITMEPW